MQLLELHLREYLHRTVVLVEHTGYTLSCSGRSVQTDSKKCRWTNSTWSSTWNEDISPGRSRCWKAIKETW